MVGCQLTLCPPATPFFSIHGVPRLACVVLTNGPTMRHAHLAVLFMLLCLTARPSPAIAQRPDPATTSLRAEAAPARSTRAWRSLPDDERPPRSRRVALAARSPRRRARLEGLPFVLIGAAGVASGLGKLLAGLFTGLSCSSSSSCGARGDSGLVIAGAIVLPIGAIAAVGGGVHMAVGGGSGGPSAQVSLGLGSLAVSGSF